MEGNKTRDRQKSRTLKKKKECRNIGESGFTRVKETAQCIESNFVFPVLALDVAHCGSGGD